MRATLGSGNNRRLLERAQASAKAVISTADLANGGRLSPEQADRFIDYVVDQTVLMKDGIRVVRMRADRHDVDELSIGSRIIRLATEGVAPTVLAGITTSRRQLSVTEIILPVDITFSTMEDNIEREGLQDHLMTMFGTQLGNDLEDLAVNGDGATPGFLAIERGWLNLLKTDTTLGTINTGTNPSGDGGVNVFDTAGSRDFRNIVFEGMLERMPNKFKANKSNLRFYTSINNEEAYRFQLAQRATGLGDAVLVDGGRQKYSGIQVVGVPYLPDTDTILTVPDNFVFGIRRDVTVGIFKNERKRVWEYTWTLRIDFQIVKGSAIVLGYDAA